MAMFSVSRWLFFAHLLVQILVPLIPGILLLRILCGQKFKGAVLYILWWFAGVGIVAFSMFNIQFVGAGIGYMQYAAVVLALLIILGAKIHFKKYAVAHLVDTLKCNGTVCRNDIRSIREKHTKIERILIGVGWIYIVGWLLSSLVHVSTLPSYADDTFNNRNSPVINIFHDGGVKIFGDESEILWRARLWYPIIMPLYKSLLVDFAGVFNDIYVNLRQRLSFFLFAVLVFHTTYKSSKNLLATIVPGVLIMWLPLVYFHAVEWYFDLASAIYAYLVIRVLYEYLQTKDHSYIPLALVFASVLIYLKNDGFVVYLPWILVAFFFLLRTEGYFVNFWKELRTKGRASLYSSIAVFLYCFLPFNLVKMYYGLWFNQAAGDAAWAAGVSTNAHREIFSAFPNLFFKQDTYNIALIFLLRCVVVYIKKYHTSPKRLLVLAPLCVLMIFILVFLLTENYKWVLDQTTVNRVFTMCLVLLFAWSGQMRADHFIKSK